ncbi:MAG TPA: alpha-ketoglutarate-dependent dioxygenase AlkB [Hyphomicrobiaceae bacterium]|nr:alpha-ketoglutarate-dependent dioxygenase AlkB [Hyphomicrobiaceae bacterium]
MGVRAPNGFRHLAGYLGASRQRAMLAALEGVLARAPLYTPAMPNSGKPLSVRMTNCGSLGWVTDKDRGYRYQRTHPVTGTAWPAIPDEVLAVWAEVAGYPAPPEACLINYYSPNARLGSHVDADEEDIAAPVVSISLGDDAVFHIGGETRSDPKQRIVLRSGDVVILGGAARLAYHGVDRIITGTSGLLPHGGRFNLTLRRVTRPL